MAFGPTRIGRNVKNMRKTAVFIALAIYAGVALAAETGLVDPVERTISVRETATDNKSKNDSVVEQMSDFEVPDPCTLTVVDCDNRAKIEAMIREVFGEDAETAIKIAECESNFEPDRVGDRHLTLVSDETGEVVGDSIGIFQIRTGGKGWNRAARNGMSADDFRAWMKNPRENIKYAKEIYDRRGWEAWHNCATRVGAYE